MTTLERLGRDVAGAHTVRPGIAVEGTPIVHPEAPHAWWTLRRAASSLGALLRTGPRHDDRALAGVSTDTRHLPQGALFVALRGERYDAHDLLHAARDAGAAAVVVEDAERAVGLGIPVLVVSDTREALGALARGWRRAWGGTVVAVGGSNGKTSTKELLRAALGARLTVHATVANENNLVGVPLTLLAIPPHAHVAVVEVGTNAPGEIAALRAVCEADVVVITSLGEEHLEGLGDLAGVLREESAILPGAPLAVLPAGELLLHDAARAHGVRVVRAGLDEGDLQPEGWALDTHGAMRLTLNGHTVTLPVRGAHQGSNAMLALAVAQALGVPMREALEAMQAMPVPRMRGEWMQLGALTVLNDAYNANPPSMRAALTLLGAVGTGRPHVAVLGTMRELGAQSARWHDTIAREAIALDLIVAVGEFAEAFDRVAPDAPHVVSAPDIDAVWPVLAPRLSHNAVLLLKGSRGMRLERLLPSLTAWATS
jgi:UDP-N-acetylmuramoyl-tripeptide--D-alanyl-D-alanine ligase